MDRARARERRCSLRRPAGFRVILLTADGKPIKGHMEDLSTGGVFVSTEQHIPPIDSAVTVDISLVEDGVDSDDINRERYRMAATVVRTSPDGVGLMFQDYDDATVRSLRRLYHETLK